jgi:hypothetical protein
MDMRIEKVVHKAGLHERAGLDKEYWHSRTPLERLEALTFLVSQYHGLDDENPPRLQRVLTVTRRRRRYV